MKYKLKKAASSVLIQHIVFWIVVVALLIYPNFSSQKALVLRGIFEDFITIFLIAISVYTNLLFLIPKLLRKRRYVFYVFTLVVGLLGISLVDVYISITIFEKDFSDHFDAKTPFLFQQIILWLSSFIMILFFVIITTFLKLLRDWLKLQDNALKIKEMERQHLEAELRSLKAQINPHFLFNTLNNLYSLSLDSSPKAPEMILKLSDLMRYIIYDCRENKVPAQKELDFLANYLSLEKLRLGDSVTVTFNIIGEPNIQIAPLLFINFIENAFKHGRKDNGSSIRVNFDFSKDQEVTFEVENTTYEELESSPNHYSGIGIENVYKRLKLLYPNKYTLVIETKNQMYCVKLNLQCYE